MRFKPLMTIAAIFGIACAQLSSGSDMSKKALPPAAEKKPITGANSFYLTPEALGEAEKSAMVTKDKNIAFQVYQHYQLGDFDAPKAKMWLVLSAEFGHPIAKYNLAVNLLNEIESRNFLGDKEMAKKLLEEAASMGHEKAAIRLNKLNSSP